jgi:tetratricopeptide (TPR) repeat protein
MGRSGLGRKNFSELLGPKWVVILILFLCIVGAYYECLPYPFLNLDDPYYINDNPYIRDLGWKGIYKIFSQPVVDNYFPLQILSYALDYQIWHLQPFGYRLHNVVLHVLNAILVFLLLKKIFSNTWVSFLAALLFGLHPVNVESVTWVAERKNVLSMALMLSSFLSYLYYLEEQRRTRKIEFYLVCLFLFFFALLAKVSAVVLPILFLLFDLSFQKRKKWEIVRDKIPFFALAFLFSVLTIWIYHDGKYLVGYHGSPYRTFLVMINVFVEYIIYLIMPVYLDHYYWTLTPQSIFERQVLLSLTAIFLIALLAWQSFRRDRIFFFWLGWFFISLLPVLNIVPITILRADRYMYLPAIGFFYLVSLGLWKINQREYRPFFLPVFLFCSLLIVGAYASLTIERNKLWKDPVIFWKESLRKFPQSAVASKYIGGIYWARGKNDLAISYFREGLRENPYEVALLNGLANVYIDKKDTGKAEELLLQAIRIDPGDSNLYTSLGVVYFQKGKMERARSYFQKALDLDPKNAFARTDLGVTFYNQNRWEEAIQQFEKAMESSPCHIEPYLNAALVYEKKRLLDKAESYLKRGLDYMPDSHATLFTLARLFFEQGRIQEAKYYLSQAYWLKPDDRNTHDFLALIAQGEANHSFPEGVRATLPPQPKAMGLSTHNPQGRESL